MAEYGYVVRFVRWHPHTHSSPCLFLRKKKKKIFFRWNELRAFIANIYGATTEAGKSKGSLRNI